jgi:hypothetical protein
MIAGNDEAAKAFFCLHRIGPHVDFDLIAGLASLPHRDNSIRFSEWIFIRVITASQ